MEAKDVPSEWYGEDAARDEIRDGVAHCQTETSVNRNQQPGDTNHGYGEGEIAEEPCPDGVEAEGRL